MKRTISLVIAVLMAISYFSIPAYAAETALSEADQLTEKACIAFPEYENIIRGQGVVNQARTFSNESPSLIVKETRAISDTEEITYFGYSDGTAILALVSEDEDFEYSTSNGSYETIPGGTSNTITVTVKSSEANGTLKMQNINFYFLSGYDRIVNTGTITTTQYCTKGTVSTKLYEDASGDAYIRIDDSKFATDATGNGGHVKIVDISFYVGQNRMAVDLSDFD